ncbi:Ankyrin repeat domain-containing protein 32 [Nosema bombycis CQ1]|uniref:Ankyrin repeat domain-containing protein 32 n=1 Tax=Nosema bombycis (strain CQ1 / CVCC 102059) TaxID=578461 RepID=R0M744_NOSB1|nr:Ankyrin repeat domain-containing protein 32 [Nosema bombycis CQ1]|eukprot:EOB13814.1 Ankyrin repeat domain-containing protein 32 [Nosema bombycis CQ1]
MITSQEFEIDETQKLKIFITTTGISEIEKSIVKKTLPTNIILEDELTTLTTYLVSYKAIITDKFVQAMLWNIKIINIDWLYDVESNPKKYEMKPLEGIEFSSSEMTNEIFNNYYTLLGGVHNENLSISTSFFISNEIEGERIDFCKKYNIPVIKPNDVFKNNFKELYKDFKINAFRLGHTKIFYDKIIFIDQTLPQNVFNQLKRITIEQEGIRVSVIDDTIDYIITNSYDKFRKYKGKVLHYQFIFDCFEYKAHLMPNSYHIQPCKRIDVLKNTVCCIEDSFKKDSLQIVNKLKALGAIIKDEEDFTCTHLIIRDKREYKKKGLYSYKIVSSEWIDQCLYTMKHIKEDKYSVKGSNLSLFSTKLESVPIKRIKCSEANEIVFQFTGLPTFLKNKARDTLDKYNVKYINSDKYENCTHLIMGNISTSEKFLAALCNGAWILRPDFIESYDGSKTFDFLKFEWTCNSVTDEKDKKIIKSVRKWREKVEESGKPAFSKWVVKFYADDAKKKSYTRVIINGGGKITEGDQYTHCFVTKNYKGEVTCKSKYTTDYIFSYLFK